MSESLTNLSLNSDLIPVFEKSLTASDAYHSTGRLVIPKKYAEVSSSAPEHKLLNFTSQ